MKRTKLVYLVGKSENELLAYDEYCSGSGKWFTRTVLKDGFPSGARDPHQRRLNKKNQLWFNANSVLIFHTFLSEERKEKSSKYLSLIP
jgi:hypothetical protein